MSLIDFGWFSSHSGFQLPWKFDADFLSDEDLESIAKILQWKFAFGHVFGVPTGGCRLAAACQKHVTSGYPVLVVADVLTTGRSMEKFRGEIAQDHPGKPIIGSVIVGRGKCPDWVWPIFSVNEWAQSRATGLG